MKYSVKDICVLTAYAGLMLSRSQIVTMLLLVASWTAFLIIALVFVLTSCRKIYQWRWEIDSNFNLIPLSGIIVAWGAVAGGLSSIPWLTLILSRDQIQLFVCSMAIGMAAASLPLMVNLDSHRMAINDSALWVGYWAIFSGMMASGVASLMLLTLEIEFLVSQNNDDRWNWFEHIRIPAIFGMVISVFTSWYLLGRADRSTIREYGDSRANRLRASNRE